MKTYLLLVLMLILIGMMMVFSSSGYFASRVTNEFAFFNAHIVKVILAIIALIVFATIPYEWYKDYSKLAAIGTVLLLLFTVIFATKIKGASRWIDIGIMKFQPSELAKIILLIHISVLLVSKGEKIQEFKGGLIYFLIWIFLIAGMVFIQPNVSLSIIIVISSFALLYVGGAKFKHLFSLSLTFGAIGAGFAMLFSHSRERILTYVDSLMTGKAINPQVLQANIALGSGGLFGVGLGQSRQSQGFVPEAYGDFIFSILGEEFGFIGSVLILVIYFALFLIGIKMANQVEDRFGKLLIFGLSFSIVLSGFINAGVVSGLLPTTGITLPFISYGGTSLIIFGMSVGIITNVVMQDHKKREIRILED